MTTPTDMLSPSTIVAAQAQHTAQSPTELFKEKAAEIEQKQAPSFWNGLRVVANFLYDAVSRVALFALIGVAALFIIPPMAYPLFTYSVVSVITRIIVHGMDQFQITCLDNLKNKVIDLAEKYPLQYISLIASVALSLIFQPGALIISSAGGIVNGSKLGVDKNRETLEFKREALKNPLPSNDELSRI
jgi:hypothetical protein